MMIVDPYRFGGSGPSTPAYIGSFFPPGSGVTATATGVSFGAASLNRLICIYVFWTSSSPVPLVSATIGGISAPPITSAITGPTLGGQYYQSALIAAIVPTGTSGTVTATFSTSGAFVTLLVSSATSITTATPFSVAAPQSGATSVLNTTVNEAAGGSVFAAVTVISGSSQVLSGVTTDYNFGDILGGSLATPSAVVAAPLSFTATGATGRTLIAASFR